MPTLSPAGLFMVMGGFSKPDPANIAIVYGGAGTIGDGGAYTDADGESGISFDGSISWDFSNLDGGLSGVVSSLKARIEAVATAPAMFATKDVTVDLATNATVLPSVADVLGWTWLRSGTYTVTIFGEDHYGRNMIGRVTTFTVTNTVGTVTVNHIDDVPGIPYGLFTDQPVAVSASVSRLTDAITGDLNLRWFWSVQTDYPQSLPYLDVVNTASATLPFSGIGSLTAAVRVQCMTPDLDDNVPPLSATVNFAIVVDPGVLNIGTDKGDYEHTDNVTWSFWLDPTAYTVTDISIFFGEVLVHSGAPGGSPPFDLSDTIPASSIGIDDTFLMTAVVTSDADSSPQTFEGPNIHIQP